MRRGADMFRGDALDAYDAWEPPTAIISDGPYGIGGYTGDPKTPQKLPEWYEPHVREWARRAMPETTLWFWNTEIGWATVHPVLERHGWEYVECCVWDKGKSHIAGNVNTGTIRRFPVVTEICALYRRPPQFEKTPGVSAQEWLRSEWKRTGLPFSDANKACGVKDAATRKYLSGSHLWYMPPPDRMKALSDYANLHGKEDGRPYFASDGKILTEGEWTQAWTQARGKFRCPFGKTNVWSVPQLSGEERIRKGARPAHPNQKPLEIIRMLIECSTDEGDVVWDPFAGTFTVAVAAEEAGRRCCCAEIDPEMFEIGRRRIYGQRNDPGQLL